MKTHPRRALVALATVAAVSAACSGSALARPVGPSPVQGAPLQGTVGHGGVDPAAAGATPTSPDFAAYYGTDPGLSSIGTAFTVPRFTCASAGTYDVASYAGLFAANGENLAVSALYVDCVGGDLTVDAEAIAGGEQAAPIPVSAGDRVVISDDVSATTDVAKLTDRTTGGVTSASEPVSDNSGAPTGFDVGLTDYNGPIPHFSPIRFESLQVDGERFAQLNPSYVDLKSGNDIQAKVTPLGGPFAQSFSLVYRHAS